VRKTLKATNVKALRAIAGRLSEYRDTIVRGLVLRVSPTGGRSFGLAYSWRNRNYRLHLGLVSRLTLGDARLEAKRLLNERDHDRDPRGQRTASKAASTLSVAKLVERCIADLEAGGGGRREMPLRPATSKEWRRIAAVEIGPAIGARPAAELQRHEVRELLGGIGSRYVANNALTLLRRSYSWGIDADLVTSSPCERIPKPKAIEASGRALMRDEIRWLAWALEGDLSQLADIIRLLQFTGVRLSMVLGARRQEIEELDGKEPRWTIPGGWAGRSKSGRSHVVPLSPSAVAVVKRRLEAHTGDCLFRSLRKDAPLTWPSEYVAEIRARMAAAMLVDLAARQDVGLDQARDQQIDRWTIHNLRHTIGTHMLEDLHVARAVVSHILGHAQKGPVATRIYDRSELLPQRRAALVSWAAWVLAAANEEKASDGRKVLPHAPRS
jgi:integrase